MSAIERTDSPVHDAPRPAVTAARRPRLGRAIGVVFLGITALVVLGAMPKLKRREALARTQAEINGPRRVLVGKVTPGPTRVEVTLPGSVAPFQSTPLYAKVTGFVRAYAADLGDPVKAGQVLAVIDAPETKEELKLAQARRQEAEANLEISKTIAARNEELSKSGLVSNQEADQQRARTNSAFAAVGSSAAEVGRLGAHVGYQRVVAPFDGVVVRRGIEKGALVTPNGSASGTILFEVAKLDTLKVFVDVPQSYAAFVKVGGTASVFAPSAPTAIVTGKIARTSGALDAATRTLRAEIHVPGDGPLLSGSFVDVRLAVDRAAPPVVVPASALVYRKEGTRLCTLDASNTVKLKKITIGRDFGKELEVLEGVLAGETVVVNPPDDLADGMVVQPIETKADGLR
jgi:RND family efflux transporter MFP subunit